MSSPEIEVFLPFYLEIRWRPKKKVFTSIWGYIRPEFGVYSCWLTLFRLNIQRPNLDGGTPNSRWGTINLDGDASPRVPPTRLVVSVQPVILFFSSFFIQCTALVSQEYLVCVAVWHSSLFTSAGFTPLQRNVTACTRMWLLSFGTSFFLHFFNVLDFTFYWWWT